MWKKKHDEQFIFWSSKFWYKTLKCKDTRSVKVSTGTISRPSNDGQENKTRSVRIYTPFGDDLPILDYSVHNVQLKYSYNIK